MLKFNLFMTLSNLRILKKVIFLMFVLSFNFSLFAQKITIKGKITDAETGDAIPYCIISFKGLNTGTNSDFDGNFKITTEIPRDSLRASYVGYKSRSKNVN